MTDVNTLITDHLDIWTTAIEAKSASGRGNSTKISLYGIKKLRELILELAVRGKLVPQEESEGMAKEILTEVAGIRQQLEATKSIRKPKSPGPVQRNEMRFDLAANWVWTRLVELAEIAPKNDANDDGLASFVPMPEIWTSHTGQHGQEERSWGEIKKGYTHFANGDIALAKITPCFENSKAAVFSNLKNGIGSGTTELHVARLFSDKVIGRFVLLHLKAPSYLENGKPIMTGSAGQKRVPRWYFSDTPIALPPTAEQHRIVAKVDELMALCEALEAQTEDSLKAHQTLVETCLATLTNSQSPEELSENWTRIETHFDTLFTTEESIHKLEQSIFELAIQGVLIPQNSDDEPASVFLRNNGLEVQQIKTPESLPPGWASCELGNLGTITGGGTPAKSNKSFWNGEIPWVSPKDMKVDFVDQAIDSISEEAIENSSAKLIKAGSLLFVVRGMILAHSFPVAITKVPVAINQDMKAVDLGDFDRGYVLLMMKALKPAVLARVERSSHGTCKLVSQKLWSIELPIPPKAEQSRIVKRVDELRSLCAGLRSLIKKSDLDARHIAEAVTKSLI